MAQPPRGKADYLELGDWNATCYRCGGKHKASTLKRQWQGYWVCARCWEPRHPQDFVRGVPDQMQVPWSQPVPGYVFQTLFDTLLLENGGHLLQENSNPAANIFNYILVGGGPDEPFTN